MTTSAATITYQNNKFDEDFVFLSGLPFFYVATSMQTTLN